MKRTSYYSALGLFLALLLPCSNLSANNDDKTDSNKQIVTTDFLKEGNQRFYSGNLTHVHQDTARVKELIKGQNPKCIIISCSDSRVPPEIIFDQGLGDIFSIRTAGNVMSDFEEGSIEYAVEHLHTPLVVVMGHQGCGAIQALLDNIDKVEDDSREKALDHVSKIVEKLKSEQEEQEVYKKSGKNSNLAVQANVINGVKQLRKSDPVLKEAYEKGEINIVGAIYHIDSGEVEFLEF